MKQICFFSSDARPLYKKDIYRVIALPKDFIIQFRYQFEYVENIDDINKYINRSCLIFFTKGNDLGKPLEEREIENIGIREGKIIETRKCTDTNLIHFFIELGDFKKIELSDDLHKKMPEKFVKELDINPGIPIDWHQVIASVKTSFKNEMFFKFDLFNNKNNPEKIRFNKKDFQSYYELDDEQDYFLHLSFYDTIDRSSNQYLDLDITEKNGILKINSPETINLDSRYDNRIFTVRTNSLESANAFTFLNFRTQPKKLVVSKSTNSENTNSESTNIESINSDSTDVTIQLQIRKNENRIILFAVLSLSTGISIGLGKYFSDNIDHFLCHTGLMIICAALSLAIGYISLSNLYQFFNKK